MKEAPEVIYLQREHGDPYEHFDTWCVDNINGDDVKYIRADLVIKQSKRTDD